jgi:hypothetical protein
MLAEERTFRTNDTSARDMRVACVSGLSCRMKRITTTDDGKIAIGIELDATDPETLESIRELIRVQQGEVFLSVEGVQGELDLTS